MDKTEKIPHSHLCHSEAIGAFTGPLNLRVPPWHAQKALPHKDPHARTPCSWRSPAPLPVRSRCAFRYSGWVADRISNFNAEVVVEQRAFKSFGVFLLVLIVLKFFLRWNVSIIGSIVLTIIVWFAMSFVNKR